MRDESDPRIGQISYLLSCLISNNDFRKIIGNIIIPKYKGHKIYNFFWSTYNLFTRYAYIFNGIPYRDISYV
jgi:hypothetical protein